MVSLSRESLAIAKHFAEVPRSCVCEILRTHLLASCRVTFGDVAGRACCVATGTWFDFIALCLIAQP